MAFPTRRFFLDVTATALGVLAAATGASAQPLTTTPTPNYVPGEVIVVYRSGVKAVQGARALRRVGADATRDARTLSRGVVRLRLPRRVSTEAAIRSLRVDPAVAYAEPNYILRALDAPPNDTLFHHQWGLSNTGQENGKPGADIDAIAAWELTAGSPDAVVAVVDTGVDYTHPDLRDNIWTNPGEIPGNGRDDDNNGVVDDVHGFDAGDDDGDPMDVHWHGTHVAGIIGAAGGNGIGTAGVNWRVRIVATKFLKADGTGPLSDAIEALDYIARLKQDYIASGGARGANVVATNNSYGVQVLLSFLAPRSLQEAIERQNKLGILYVAACGNSDPDGFLSFLRNNDTFPTYPASFNNANLIAVAATDRGDGLAGFSHYGARSVHLGAPGVDIASTVPGGWATASGTSMAAPHVTGALALLSVYAPQLGPAQLKERLLATGDPLPLALYGKTSTGRRLNVNNALRDIRPAAPRLALTVGTDRPAYAFSQIARITVTAATPDGQAVAGASVRIVVALPNGGSRTLTGKTNAEGSLVLTMPTRRTDGSGTYTATVTVTQPGFSPGGGGVTFTVS